MRRKAPLIESISFAAEFGDEEESNYNRTFFNKAPYIEYNTDDVSLEPGSNFTITCKDTVKVTWRVPHELADFIEVTEIESFDSHWRFASQMTIDAVDFRMAGFYYCLQDDEETANQNVQELVENFRANPFYIFVDGEIQFGRRLHVWLI